jgi:E3 ubiquitin-protein ligase RNF213
MYWQLRDLHHQESLIQKWCKWQKTWEMNKDFYNPFTRGTDGESVKAQVVHFSMKTAKEFAAKLFTEDGAIQSSSRARSSTESKTQNNNNNNTQNVVDQFRHLDEWGSSNHECLLFQISGDRRSGQSGGGLTFLSLKPQAMRSNLQQNQKQLFTELQTNQVVIGGNLDEIRGSFHEILGTVTGKFRTKAECESLLEGKFCVTGDAVLKMVAIFLRLKCGIPCVIMGDAGCGKTFLIKYLAAYLDIRRISLDIHGGTSRLDILGAVSEANAYARQGHEVLLFLDEVNTCNHMGLLNEIICSHSYYGTQIDSNVHIIGACNPYIIKPKSQDEDRAGLALQREQHNEMDNLVYKVQPVPATMLQYVFDFGALDLKTEQLYITSVRF